MTTDPRDPASVRRAAYDAIVADHQHLTDPTPIGDTHSRQSQVVEAIAGYLSIAVKWADQDLAAAARGIRDALDHVDTVEARIACQELRVGAVR